MKRSFVFVFKRRLQDVWIRLGQSEYIRFSHKSSEDVIKTSWSRPISSGHTSSRRLQEVFAKHFENALKSSRRSTKACSRHLQDVLPKCLQDVFKTSSSHLAKTSSKLFSRHVQGVLQSCFQGVFKTHHQVKLFVLTPLRDMFNTFLGGTAKTVICKRICLSHTSQKFIVSVQNLSE